MTCQFHWPLSLSDLSDQTADFYFTKVSNAPPCFHYKHDKGKKSSSIGNGGTSAFLDGANSLPIVLFKKWGKSLGIKMEFFETALDLD